MEQLNTELITMGGQCESAISMAIKALLDGDALLRKHTFTVGAEISQRERTIESACIKLLLQQQPVARDLRMISSALKMIYDMERIGILACDIAEISALVEHQVVSEKFRLRQMTTESVKMVSDSVRAFIKSDLSLADSVVAYDDVIDALFDEIKRELIALIVSDGVHSEYCIDLLMIAKYLEKIADHAVNIAGWVRYSITGTHATE